MISAKDEFFLEEEMMKELNNLIYDSGIAEYERWQILERINTEKEYEMEIINLQSGQMFLNKIRNGETLLQSQINKAVDKAVSNE